MVSVFVCEVFCEMLGGCAPRKLKPFLSAAHAHTAYTKGVRPLSFEVFCVRESRSTGTIQC